MSNKYSVIVLMGIQGSGKGTQGQLLADDFGFTFLEAGGMFRDEVKSGSKLGQQLDEIIHVRGELVPDEITKELISSKIKEIDPNSTVILDGYPRTKKQLHDLDEILNKADRDKIVVVNVKITDKETLERLSKRKICEKCKSFYRDEGQENCSKCNSKLTRRADETPEKIKTRLAWSHKETDPVIEEYRERGILVEVNGSPSIKEVYQEVKKKLDLQVT